MMHYGRKLMNKPGQRSQQSFHPGWRTRHMKLLWMKTEYQEQMELCIYARERSSVGRLWNFVNNRHFRGFEKSRIKEPPGLVKAIPVPGRVSRMWEPWLYIIDPGILWAGNRGETPCINRHGTRWGLLRFLISAHLWEETLLCTVVVVVVVVIVWRASSAVGLKP